ncbi:MAG: hypothetical protein JWO09_758 [Bacteroidetes bacterium]|nr:hypothetical protein [Bacteroidota bacterium]
MDYTQYTVVKNHFIKSPNLCDLFKLLSIETWKRMEYAYLKPGVKIYETTITQNLIFSINAYNDQYNLKIQILEADDEATNGNDFELVIRFPAEGVEFYAPVQAKKIYKNGKYSSMDHGDQIVSLQNYARARRAVPFYLLYNFAPSPLHIDLTDPMELTGCTLLSAEYLHENFYNKRKKRGSSSELAWTLPSFFDLNPSPSFPWHQIVCPGNSQSLFDHLFEKKVWKESELKKRISEGEAVNGFFTLNTFNRDKGWSDVKDLKVPFSYDNKLISSKEAEIPEKYRDIIGKNITKDLMNNEISKDLESGGKKRGLKKMSEIEKVYPDFSPKSRIIISKE